MAIIGAGIYGLHIARLLGGMKHQVDVFEKESSGMQMASKLNQARVHGGYHYPRSIQTAARSQRNYGKFISEFSSCVDGKSKSIYGIAKDSKVSPEKFWRMSKMIGAQIEIASEKYGELFDKTLITQTFLVEECSFNSQQVLAQLLQTMPESVTIQHNLKIQNYKTVSCHGDGEAEVYLSGDKESFGPYHFCIDATYGEFVSDNLSSNKLMYEVCELMHVKVPGKLENLAVTVMDGPFFSMTPWPAFGEKVLTHVKFTPHSKHTTYKQAREIIESDWLKSRYEVTIRDCERYLPAARDVTYLGSKFVVKTILKSRDFDDARPILAQKQKQILHLIGSKIDNIYDADDVVLNFLRGNHHY